MWILVNLLLLLLIQYVLTFVHEFGHAYTAKFLNFRVQRVTIGFGKQLLVTNKFGFPLVIATFPFGGATVALPTHESFWRLRLWFVTLAGPATHITFLLMVALLSPQTFNIEVLLPSLFVRIAPFEMTIVANVLFLIVNLFPSTFATSTGNLSNDGYALLSLPFTKRSDFMKFKELNEQLDLIKSWKGLPATELIKRLEAQLENSAHRDKLKHSIATLSRYLGAYNESRKMLTELLPSNVYAGEAQRNRLIGEIAWIDAVLGDADLLDEADKYSASAYMAASSLTYTIRVRGAVLVRLGHCKEGIKFLRKAYKDRSDPQSRSESAIFIAVGESKNGNLRASKRWISAAKKLDPHSKLISHLECEIMQNCSDIIGI